MPMRRRDFGRYGAYWLASGGLVRQNAHLLLADGKVAEPKKPAPHSIASFPLQVSANRRYLVDQNRHPFFIVGDSAQGIYSHLTADDISVYLSTRRKQNFNTLLVEPLHYGGKGDRVLPSADGHLPFLKNIRGDTYDGAIGSADLSTPNPAYWDYVDLVLTQTLRHGFLVISYVVSWGPALPKPGLLSWIDRNAIPREIRRIKFWTRLDNAVLGEPQGCGFWQDLINYRNTESVCHRFGQWLGARYRKQQNIIWLHGNDFSGNATPHAPDNTSGIQRSLAVLRGMQEAGAMQLCSGDWAPETLSTDQADFAPFMDINGVYTYGAAYQSTYSLARRGYLYRPAMPTYLKETGYEDENAIPGDPASVRKYEWWCVLSGAIAGAIYGNRAIWPFLPGRWKTALNAPGALDMARMAGLMTSVAWQDLVPSELGGTRRLVTSANGSQVPAIPNYVATAQTPDGTLLMAYVPPYLSGPRNLSLDLRSMRKLLRARWWDPTSGDFTFVGESLGRAVQSFTTPGTNHAGSNDWVLLLQA